jgi:hypothetical protein
MCHEMMRSRRVRLAAIFAIGASFRRRAGRRTRYRRHDRPRQRIKINAELCTNQWQHEKQAGDYHQAIGLEA